MSTPTTPGVDSPERAVYVRHRDRMIRESVFEDLRDTLIACRWLAGTTTRPVHRLDTGALEIVTTAPNQVLRLLHHPLNVIEYFPDTQGTTPGAVPLNTLAMDVGRQGDTQLVELGSSMRATEHVFAFAFYAEEDAVAQALLNDLRDRYQGLIVNGDAVDLYNYLADPPSLVSRMEVDLFRYIRDAERVTPEQVHLYFAELTLLDVA